MDKDISWFRGPHSGKLSAKTLKIRLFYDSKIILYLSNFKRNIRKI
jgi:hypothetical protein